MPDSRLLSLWLSQSRAIRLGSVLFNCRVEEESRMKLRITGSRATDAYRTQAATEADREQLDRRENAEK